MLLGAMRCRGLPTAAWLAVAATVLVVPGALAGDETLSWDGGPNACYCDPISTVDDCAPAMCTGFRVSQLVLFSLLLIAVSVQLATMESSRTRARPILLVFVFLLAFSRALRFALLLGNVGEKDIGAMYFVNMLLIIGGACLLSGLTLVVYIWAKIHVSAVGAGSGARRQARFHRQILIIINAIIYTLLILFNVLEVTTRMSIFSTIFNFCVGAMVLGVCTSFLTYGMMLYRLASANPLVSRTNSTALGKVTRLVGTVSGIGIFYVIMLIIFGVADNRSSTEGLVSRHVFYRLVEVVVGFMLLITFHQTKGTPGQANSAMVSSSAAISIEGESAGAPTGASV